MQLNFSEARGIGSEGLTGRALPLLKRERWGEGKMAYLFLLTIYQGVHITTLTEAKQRSCNTQHILYLCAHF